MSSQTVIRRPQTTSLRSSRRSRGQVKAVAVDRWDPFMTATRENAPGGGDIVHDKFHVAKDLSQAVDDLRKRELREMSKDDPFLLLATKDLWLTNRENWDEVQRATFAELRSEGLKVGFAWAIKEAFSQFWEYSYEGSAEKFFRRWSFRTASCRAANVRPPIE